MSNEHLMSSVEVLPYNCRGKNESVESQSSAIKLCFLDCFCFITKLYALYTRKISLFIYLYIIHILYMLRTLPSLILCIWFQVSVLWHIYVCVCVCVYTHTYLLVYISIYLLYIYVHLSFQHLKPYFVMFWIWSICVHICLFLNGYFLILV